MNSEKHFEENQIEKTKKKTENQSQNAACEQNKPLARNDNLVQTKTGKHEL